MTELEALRLVAAAAQITLSAADDYEAAAKEADAWDEGEPIEIVIRGIQGYLRAALGNLHGVTSGSAGPLNPVAGSTPADATGLGSSKEIPSPLDPGRTNLVVENDNGTWAVAHRGYSPFATFDSEADARFYVRLREERDVRFAEQLMEGQR